MQKSPFERPEIFYALFSFTLLGPYGDTDFWKDNVMVEEKSKQKEKEQWSSYNNLIIARGASDQ